MIVSISSYLIVHYSVHIHVCYASKQKEKKTTDNVAQDFEWCRCERVTLTPRATYSVTGVNQFTLVSTDFLYMYSIIYILLLANIVSQCIVSFVVLLTCTLQVRLLNQWQLCTCSCNVWFTLLLFQIHQRCVNSAQSVELDTAIASEPRRLSPGPRRSSGTSGGKNSSPSYWTSPIWTAPRLTNSTVTCQWLDRDQWPRPLQPSFHPVCRFRVSVGISCLVLCRLPLLGEEHCWRTSQEWF